MYEQSMVVLWQNEANFSQFIQWLAKVTAMRDNMREQIIFRSYFVEGIIGRAFAHSTSARGGGRPTSTRSRLPAGFGKRRTEWGGARADKDWFTDKLERQGDQDRHQSREPRP
jgi:hypothetical protein